MKEIIEQKEFKVPGEFESMYAAQDWLRENGYDYGSTSCIEPVAIMKGNYYDYDLPLKMKNFTMQQKDSVHGIMRGNMREGPVFIYLYK
jgi:hypothetical protein